MRNDIKRSVTGPEGSFPNPGEGTLITEITFEANVDPEDRFPGYGLYKVFLASLEYSLFFGYPILLIKVPCIEGSDKYCW